MCCAIPSKSDDEYEYSESDNDETPVAQYKGLPATCGDFEGVRIINGKKTGILEFPWMVLLEGKKNKRKILTDSSCAVHNFQILNFQMFNSCTLWQPFSTNYTTHFIKISRTSISTLNPFYLYVFYLFLYYKYSIDLI